MTNLLNIGVTQPSKYRRKYWVEINDDSSGSCNTKVKLNLRLHC